MTLLPFAEWRPDISDYQSGFISSLGNVLPRGDGYGPFPDFSSFSKGLSIGGFSSGFSSGFQGAALSPLAACRGFFKAIRTDGSVAVFAATSTKLYSLNNTTQAWTDVSKSGAAYSALSSTDQWQFVQYINFVIAVQANVAPQFFDLTSSTEFADLAGSPPQARYSAVVGDFVVLTGLLNNPYRVQWSALGDPTGWTAGLNSSDFQDLPDGGIVRSVAGGEYGNIFQDTAIRRLIYAPGSPIVFQIERISDDRGLYAPYSVIRSGGQIFYLGPQGFQQMDPQGLPQPIGKEKVDRMFFTDVDKGNIQLILGASDPKNARVFWAYKSNSGSIGLFDKLLCYDYVLSRWTPIAMSGEFIASLSQPGLTIENIDSISSSIDALIPSLDSFATSVTPEVAMFDPSHQLGFFRGPNLEATMATAAQAIGMGRRAFVRGLLPYTDASIVFGSVGAREGLDATEVISTEQQMDSTRTVPQRVSTRFARARLRIPAGTTWTFATGVEPDFTQEGYR